MEIERVVFTKLVPIDKQQRLHEFEAEAGWLIEEPENGRVRLSHRARDIELIVEGHEYTLHLVPNNELQSAVAAGASESGGSGEGASVSPPLSGMSSAAGQSSGSQSGQAAPSGTAAANIPPSKPTEGSPGGRRHKRR